MTQPKLKEEQLNKSINASRDEHSLSYHEDTLEPRDKIHKDQVGTGRNGDAVIAKLEAPAGQEKGEKEEIMFATDTPLHKYSEQNEINRNQNKENHLSYTEDLSRRYGEDSPAVNQNVVIPSNAVSAPEQANRDQNGQNREQINPSRGVQAQPPQQVYYRPVQQPIQRPVTHRRGVPTWVVILLLLAFIAIMIGIIAWGIIKYKKRMLALRKEYLGDPYTYISVPPKIVDPISQSQYESSFKNLPDIIPTNSGKEATKNPHSKPIPIASKVETTVVSNSRNSFMKPSSKPIILPRGNQIMCPFNQLLVNGNCLSCKEGEEWIGLDCVPIQQNHRHMKKRYS